MKRNSEDAPCGEVCSGCGAEGAFERHRDVTNRVYKTTCRECGVVVWEATLANPETEDEDVA